MGYKEKEKWVKKKSVNICMGGILNREDFSAEAVFEKRTE